MKTKHIEREIDREKKPKRVKIERKFSTEQKKRQENKQIQVYMTTYQKQQTNDFLWPSEKHTAYNDKRGKQQELHFEAL